MTVDQEFIGNERFEIRRRLGAGTFGVVYEAYDRARKLPVALKSLRRINPQSIYNFKQEFRALTDIAHPNLASLYELFLVSDQWFFTMELVEGVDFLAYVREGEVPKLSPTESISSGSPTLAEGELGAVSSPELPPLSEGRLREATRQLAEGLYSLHSAGKLHRDLKPSNVLCSTKDRAQCRIVILDFGLILEQEEAAIGSRFVVGTAAYMSPEQAAGQPLTPASDWYSVGVMLFQSLTGTLPFIGEVRDVLARKQTQNAPLLHQFATSLPEDLEALTMELLQRRPSARPSGEEVLRRLGGRSMSHSLSTELPLVGREAQRGELHALLRASREACEVAAVRGASGMGKSTLLQTFLREAAKEGALVLQGRCYERESVPYKALDGLLDSLCRHLMRLPISEVEGILPPGIEALARLFPVLRRVRPIARAEPTLAQDPKELRRLAFLSLRELLSELSQKQALVLVIDDLQWGDLDSAALLEDLLSSGVPLLFIAAYRSEEAERSPFLQSFLSNRPKLSEVEVSPLALHEALDLTLQLLGEDDLVTKIRPDAIAKEAQGSPYFVEELVRYLREEPRRVEAFSSGQGLTLEGVISARIEALPAIERRLLEVIAVAGQPLRSTTALGAAGLSANERTPLTALQAARLISLRGDDLAECFHDRIREVAASLLSEEKRKAYHLQLANALVEQGDADPEALVFHLRGAGSILQAAQYAERAAKEATSALAFEKAARLYQIAVDLGEHPPKEKQQLQKSRAESLANAGRSGEAGAAYLETAKSVKEEAQTFQERAAAEYLRGGFVEEGLGVLRSILEEADLPMAKSPGRALVRLLWSRLKIEIKGRRFTETPTEKISPEILRKIDLCWSIAIGLGNIDTIHGADFQAKQMLLALEAGEPYRVARALCIEASFVAADGGKKRDVVETILSEAKALCERLKDPYLEGLFAMVRGEVLFLLGEFFEAEQRLKEAQEIFRSRCLGISWEMATLQSYSLYSLYYLGEITTLAKLQSRLSREAAQRGDLYAATAMRSGHCVMGLLASDQADEARRMVKEASERWSPKGFQVQHFTTLLMSAEICLYLGDAEAAYQMVSESWPKMKKSLLLNVQLIRIEATHLRARCALAAAAKRKEHKSLRKEVERDIEALQKEKMPWGMALSSLLSAGLYSLQGQKEEALRDLVRGSQQLDALHFRLFAAAARYRRGALLGGQEGEALCEEARSTMSQQKLQRPEAWVAMLAPGF